MWKAPANETIRGVLDVERAITQAEQGVLNPIGINCIRPFGTARHPHLGRPHAGLATPTGRTSTSAGCST